MFKELIHKKMSARDEGGIELLSVMIERVSRRIIYQAVLNR